MFVRKFYTGLTGMILSIPAGVFERSLLISRNFSRSETDCKVII